MRRWVFLMMAAMGFLAADFAWSAEAATAPLADYVGKPDASYRWITKRTGRILAAEYAELILTSQTWRDIVWKHQVFVIKPYSMPKDVKHALLFISGGSWRDELETGEGQAPKDAQMYVTLAELLKTPVVVLLHVPHQPIFDGKREDAAIAYTFDEYLRTGDAEWPLLLPMVKSAVRGMDAAQEFARTLTLTTTERLTRARGDLRLPISDCRMPDTACAPPGSDPPLRVLFSGQSPEQSSEQSPEQLGEQLSGQFSGQLPERFSSRLSRRLSQPRSGQLAGLRVEQLPELLSR